MARPEKRVAFGGPLIERGLSVERLRELLRLDPVTGDLYWLDRRPEDFSNYRSWCAFQARLAGKPALRKKTSAGYRRGLVESKEFFAHRIVFALYFGFWPPKMVDHRNGDRSDNRPPKLKAVDAQGNSLNREVSTRNTSGVVGVSFHSRCGKWQVQIGNPSSHLGYFDRFEHAVAVRLYEEKRRGFTVRPRVANSASAPGLGEDRRAVQS